MVKKSYNPLKMWIAWLGLFISLLIPISTNMGTVNVGIELLFGRFELIFYPIIGFLVGWGIHSLIRKYA